MLLNHMRTGSDMLPEEVELPCTDARLEGELAIPPGAHGVVVFAHGSGSGRRSPRNQFVARAIRESGNGTLLFDLLTPEEATDDFTTGHLRFDIPLLARRLVDVTRWLAEQPETRALDIGYFGSSTGGGAALVAAAEAWRLVGAIVSRGGRPDLAAESLRRVHSPTLLIVGGFDHPVIRLNEEALDQMHCEKMLKVVPRATHLFEEHGALETVAQLAAKWFRYHLRARQPALANLRRTRR
jgi:dienelactone hydrolase